MVTTYKRDYNCFISQSLRFHLEKLKEKGGQDYIMSEGMIGYVCPSCRAEIQIKGEEEYWCANCSASYPIVQDIPDFRLPFERDASKSDSGQQLIDLIIKNYKNMTFEDLLKLRLSFGKLPNDIYELHMKHELNAIERGRERLSNIKYILRARNKALIKRSLCLDLGCGMGSALFALSDIFRRGVGLDISLIDLLLTKKRFEERGIHNVDLVCASVESLPFRDNTFDLINATDVIEHIAGQEKFLMEANRVLASGGYFYFNSPNRFNIFGPEPHVNVWGVGFLPRRYMDRYVQLIKGVRYSGKRLFSYFELHQMVKKVFRKNYIINGILVGESAVKRSLKLSVLKTFPILLKLVNYLFKPFIPGYHILVFKPTSLNILTLTSLFPNRQQPFLGVFVKERMAKVAKFCNLKIVAPVPWFPPFRIFKKWYPFSQIPLKETREGIEVFHPRFIIIPKMMRTFYGLLYFLSVFPYILKIRRRFDFDLIDAHWIYPDGFAAVLIGNLFKKPVVVSARGTDINLYPKRLLIRKQIVYTLKNADKIIAVCEALKNKMIRLGISQDKIEVIPNGVDIEKFKPISKIEARKELNLPIDKKMILSVGHLVEKKGFHYLIDAIYEIKNNGNRNAPPLLVIVGKGDYRLKLENKIKELNLDGGVKLVGAQSHNELYKWYSAADLFVLASSSEGWPNVIFESLACGIPVVATNVDGVPEVLCSDEYGILVDKQDGKCLADTIITALHKTWDYKKLIGYAQENTWDKCAEKIFKQFEEVVNKGK